jgi:hypothetical protein
MTAGSRHGTVQPMLDSPIPLTIRRASDDDRARLITLAALDSSTVPRAPVLLAERAGRPLAAVSAADGHVVADPFQRTEDAVALLRLRVRQLARRAA